MKTKFAQSKEMWVIICGSPENNSIMIKKILTKLVWTKKVTKIGCLYVHKLSVEGGPFVQRIARYSLCLQTFTQPFQN
jgi:hypothetical protein